MLSFRLGRLDLRFLSPDLYAATSNPLLEPCQYHYNSSRMRKASHYKLSEYGLDLIREL